MRLSSSQPGVQQVPPRQMNPRQMGQPPPQPPVNRAMGAKSPASLQFSKIQMEKELLRKRQEDLQRQVRDQLSLFILMCKKIVLVL